VTTWYSRVEKSLKTSIDLNTLCTAPALSISLLFWTSFFVPASGSNYSVRLIANATEPLHLRTTHSASEGLCSEETQDDRQRLHFVIFIAGHRHQRHWSNSIPVQIHQTPFTISKTSLDRQCYPLRVSTNKLWHPVFSQRWLWLLLSCEM